MLISLLAWLYQWAIRETSSRNRGVYEVIIEKYSEAEI